MKKIFLALSCVVAFSACQKEDVLVKPVPADMEYDWAETPNGYIIPYAEINRWEDCEKELFFSETHDRSTAIRYRKTYCDPKPYTKNRMQCRMKDAMGECTKQFQCEAVAQIPQPSLN